MIVLFLHIINYIETWNNYFLCYSSTVNLEFTNIYRINSFSDFWCNHHTYCIFFFVKFTYHSILSCSSFDKRTMYHYDNKIRQQANQSGIVTNNNLWQLKPWRVPCKNIPKCIILSKCQSKIFKNTWNIVKQMNFWKKKIFLCVFLWLNYFKVKQNESMIQMNRMSQ